MRWHKLHACIIIKNFDSFLTMCNQLLSINFLYIIEFTDFVKAIKAHQIVFKD